MEGVLMLADSRWMEYQTRHSMGGLAIFFASPHKRTKLDPLAALFCVRSGTPPRDIVAAGFVQAQNIIHEDAAWALYGRRLGADNEAEWRRHGAKVLENSRRNYDSQLLAIELVDFQPFAEPVSPIAVGLSDRGWQDRKRVDAAATARLLELLGSSTPQPRRLPRIDQLRERLSREWEGVVPRTPERLKEVQRLLRTYERPKAITQYLKQTRGADCQLCGVAGFVKRDGSRYCEVHHLFHLSTNPPADCLAPEYLVVLCATCHRRMHHCNVGTPQRQAWGWSVSVDGVEHRFTV